MRIIKIEETPQIEFPSLYEIYEKLFDIGFKTLENIELNENIINFLEEYFKFMFQLLEILKIEVIFK